MIAPSGLVILGCQITPPQIIETKYVMEFHYPLGQFPCDPGAVIVFALTRATGDLVAGRMQRHPCQETRVKV
jgi:hypothetical protein